MQGTMQALHSCSQRVVARCHPLGLRTSLLGSLRGTPQHIERQCMHEATTSAVATGMAPHISRCRSYRRAVIKAVSSSYTTSTAAPGAGGSGAYAGAPRVCILGGGFGGLYTAIKLESLIWPRSSKPQVTLVDQNERFVFKPLLYELLNGTAQAWEVAPTFAQLLAPYPVRFVQAKVQGVEPEQLLPDGGSATGGRVLLSGGEVIEYDWLVVALGAESDPRGVPGVREYAVKFTDLEDAVKIKEKLEAFEARASASVQSPPVVVVVGAGCAGVEVASVIAERMKGSAVVQVVTPGPTILEQSPEGQREAAMRALLSLGVDVRTNTKVTKLTGIDSSSAGPSYVDAAYGADERCIVHTEPMTASTSGWDGQQQTVADLVLWTAGSSPASKGAKSLPFPKGAKGTLEVDPTLRVLSQSRVFALGDVSARAESAGAAASLPATAQVAFQEADYAAWNVWASINGRPLLPFRYQHLGDMMSLGAANAAVALPLQLPDAVRNAISGTAVESMLSLAGLDVDKEVTVKGPVAQLLRRAAYLYRQPTNEQRLNVAASWVQQAADLGTQLSRELLRGAGSSARQ